MATGFHANIQKLFYINLLNRQFRSLRNIQINALISRSPTSLNPHYILRGICSSNSKMSSENIIAAIQLNSTHDKERNLSNALKWIDESVRNNARVVCLPEGFDFIGRSKDETALLSERLDGPLIERFKNKAKEHGVWLLLGGFHEKLELKKENGDPWLANSHVAIDDKGEIVSVYRKTHLFDVVIPAHKINLQESSYVKAGEEILNPVSTPVGHIGLGICYDLRFPEFSLELRRLGSEIITYPSAFTVVTGRAHWETLLRARAIETQCYVVAAAQVGRHNEKRESYGHSLIISGWGDILAHATTEDEQAIYASVDLGQLEEKRSSMPVENHRRYDLYGAGTTFSIPEDSMSDVDFDFGQVKVKGKFIFLQSRFSYATVNKKCVVPGHVLVITKRCVSQVADLTPSEMADLFMLAKEVVKIVDSFFQATSSTIAVQDGPEAGQTIRQVHVHVLPRHSGDFKENNDVYQKMESHDKGEVVWREEKDMLEEANKLRDHIRKSHANILR